MPEVPLSGIQRWMQEVVVHPGRVREAIRSPQARKEVDPKKIGEVILPSRTLDPEERVDIYHGMYLIRMEEALQSDYRGVQEFLGNRGFRKLVANYVQSFPSRSFTLNRLSDHLPEFILSQKGFRSRGFCYDLARLELAIAQVFDEEETPPLTPEEIAAFPEDAWEHARLEPIRPLRLLSFKYSVNTFLQSVRDGRRTHPRPRLKDTFAAIHRRSYSVYRLDLSRTAYDLLSDLVSGTTLGDAVQKAARRGRGAAKEDELFRWFREWISGGIFRKVEALPSPTA
jgi:hypothetical protein